MNAEQSVSRWRAFGTPTHIHSQVHAVPYYCPASREGSEVQGILPLQERLRWCGFFDYCFSPNSRALLNFYSNVNWKAQIYSQFSPLLPHQLLFFFALCEFLKLCFIFTHWATNTIPRGAHYSDFRSPFTPFS